MSWSSATTPASRTRCSPRCCAARCGTSAPWGAGAPTQARRERLRAAGFDTEAINRIHGPIGLDIGAETPAEVAISILAEMIQVRYGAGTGRSLRGREGRIHRQRTDDEGDI